MEDLETFPVEEFYEALMSPSGLQEKLEGILKEIKKKNMEMTYQSVLHIHQILNSKLQPPLMKLNALNCTKILFGTCEYSVTLLIEVYLLPIVFQIAAFRSTKKSQEALSLYFIQRGAQPTKQIKRLGLNYVILAIQFIYVTSQIKMFRMLENDELQEESNYKKIAKALKMRGVFETLPYKFYNSSYIQQTRRIFLDKLSVFNPESFIQYMGDLIFTSIVQDKHSQLDSKRLIMFGDVYIISPLVNQIQEELNEIHGSFQAKKNILTLLFELVRFGFAEAILLLNSSQFLAAIANEVSKVNGDKDMDEGRLIYQQIEDSHRAKKTFYLQFLKCIETWSHAIPLNQNNEQSDAKRIYEFLKYEKKFKFPDNANTHKYKSEMDIYLRQNTQRNERVIELIDSKDTLSNHTRYKISTLNDQSNIKDKSKKNTLQFEELQQIIINAMMILEVIGFSSKKYEKQMKKLLNFKQNWHKNLGLVKKSISQSNEPFNLDMLVTEGEIVYEQVMGLEKIYNEFKEQNIKFEAVQQKINALLNQLEQQIPSNSQVSVSAKSKNTHLTNRRQLRSKISQRARNDKSDHSKASYVSQNKSAKSKVNLNRAKSPLNKQLPQKAQNQTSHGKLPARTTQIKEKFNDTFAFNKEESFCDYGQNIKADNSQTNAKQTNKNKTKAIRASEKIASTTEQPKTATFIPIRFDNESSIKQSKVVNESQKSKNKLLLLESQASKGQRQKQVFSDSFQALSPFSLKESESFKKKENLLKEVSVEQEKQQRTFQKKKNNSKLMMKQQKGKHELIKRMLSNQKVTFNKINTSQSQDEQMASNKAPTNNNKTKSKLVSFNNGNNASAYFNQQSQGSQYGFNNQNNLLKKLARQIKQNSKNGNGSNQLNKNIVKEEVNKPGAASGTRRVQKESEKFNTSKEISKISTVQQQKISVDNFDDFQLVNNNNKSNNQNSNSNSNSNKKYAHQIEAKSNYEESPSSSFGKYAYQQQQPHQQIAKPYLNKVPISNNNNRNEKNILKQQLLAKQNKIENNWNQDSANIKRKQQISVQQSRIMKMNITQNIKQPQSFQMMDSHYLTKEIEDNKLKQKENLNFGQIVEVNRQIIHDRNNCISPAYRQDPRKKKTMELIQLKNNSNTKQQLKQKHIFEVLSERSTKKCIEHYLIEKEKNKLIQNLNLRIHRLENQENTIKTVLSKKDDQLRSMTFRNYSQRNRMKFIQEVSGQCSLQSSSRGDMYSFRDNETSNNNNSLCYYKNSNESLPHKNHLPTQLNSSQQPIDLTIYDKFLQSLTTNLVKKNCIKNKSLIFVNEEVQIGCMSLKKDTFINFTLYVTPKLFNIVDLTVSATVDENLSISIYPDLVYAVKLKKQETINVKITIQNVPFSIPKLKFNYQMEAKVGLKNGASHPKHQSTFDIYLPCTFNRLFTFESMNISNFNDMWSAGEIEMSIKRCSKFKLNSKIFKQQKFRQYFPYLCLLRRKQGGSGKVTITYGFEANYNGNVVLVKLGVENKKYCLIEMKNMMGEAKSDKYLQYLMATLRKLLMN